MNDQAGKLQLALDELASPEFSQVHRAQQHFRCDSGEVGRF
jgi:hypothetical protein